MKEVLLHARRVGSEIETIGSRFCSLGHKLPCSSGGGHNGIFAEWRLEDSGLSVENDRYGFYPLYYFHQGSEICISTSIPRLIQNGAPRELDERALALFLRLGFFIGEDTPFKSIRALPPNAVLEWKAGDLQLSGGYTFAKRQDISRQDALEGYIDLFGKSIQRRLPVSEDFAVPLTGGRDSRHILLELYECGYRPRILITHKHYPPRCDEDAKVAGILAKELKLPHTVIDQRESWLGAEYRKNLLTNFCSDEHGQCLAMADYLQGRASVVYDGIAGDVLSAGLFLTPHLLELVDSGDLVALANGIIDSAPTVAGFSENGLKLILSPEVYARLDRELAVNHLAAELQRHVSAANPLSSFFFWNRTRREIALLPYRLLAGIPNVYSPYLDHDLFDFLSSLPPAVTASQSFHNEAIHKGYPRYAHIPFEMKGIPGNDDFNQCVQTGRELARLVLLSKPSRLMRNASLRARLLRGLVNRAYCRSGRWSFYPLVLYLHQLERCSSPTGEDLRRSDGWSRLVHTSQHASINAGQPSI